MRVGIDSYAYHRFFGEVRPGESSTDQQGWTVGDFVRRAAALGVDGVSIESLHLDLTSDSAIAELRALLDEAGLDRVLAWGHPDGLAMGTNATAVHDAWFAVDRAAELGCELLRIMVGTTRFFGQEDESVVVERVTPMIAQILERASASDLPVALETHCDLTLASMLGLLEVVDHPGLGVVLDTANLVRIGEDPLVATALLAPWLRMLHLKDLDLEASASPGDAGGWWPCVPLGTGDVDLVSILEIAVAAGFDGLACVEVADIPEGLDEDLIVEQSVRWLRAAPIDSQLVEAE